MNENREIIPSSSNVITAEQNNLMVRINKLVGGLFEQDKELKPSLQLNGEDWHRLRLIRDKPDTRISYSVMQMDAAYYSHVWLNLYLSLSVYHRIACSTYSGWGWAVIALTPKQTFWICRQLQDDKLLMGKIQTVVLRQAEKLHQSAEEIKNLVSDNKLFIENSRKNKVFDSAVKEYESCFYTNPRIRAFNARILERL